MTEERKDLTTGSGAKTPSTITLGKSTSLDLSHLPEEVQVELQAEYTKGMIDLNKKAQELNIDEAALRNTLDDLNETTKQATDANASITVSHTQSSSIGRTEIIMGNTDQARRGKLTKSQTGETNWTPIYVVIGIIALLILAGLMTQ
jgi:FlaG/FlaF family flagellin (archaellin)